ncbi:MAG: TonB-dependent receptor [Flammeovirgaceae bacterium]
MSVTLAQDATIQGKVIEAGTNDPLIGANVVIEGTTKGASTDAEGNYKFEVSPGDYTIVASFIGMKSVKQSLTAQAGQTYTLNFTLEADGLDLSELVVIGSRNSERTALETPVPVDVINVADIAVNSAQITVNELLNYVAPSFSSNKQTISDGTDHIDPASLRGLGPDQVLVLINGKRRHNTSLINVNGTFGRGAVGTDMNAIPVAAIARIEVLRDGAAAQYGSDAIAGVINIVLKSDVNTLNVTATTGAYFSKNSEGTMDGEAVQIGLNYGLPVGQDGGYINFTGNFDNRDYTNRMKRFTGQIFDDYNNPTDFPNPTGADITESELLKRGLTRSDFNMRVGQSAVENAGFFVNSSIPLTENSEFYAFGGLTYRHGEAAGFYRLPYQARTVTSIYPNGFLPEIHSNILDKSIALGIKGKAGEWNIDFSNVYGSNSFQFQIENTLNASLEEASPTSFNSGGFVFAQNTATLDVSRYWKDVLSGVNIAFGIEHRIDNYQIFAGEEASYTNYGLASQYITSGGDTILISDPMGPINTVFDERGNARPGGAQVFPGFSPDNEVNAFRTNLGAYVDVEADFTEKFYMTAALRYERYSDFGSTLNGKVSLRYEFNDNFAFRAAASTGFRAPSLHQLHFNSTSTVFVDGIPSEVGTFSNDSRPAQLLGIPQLTQETSSNLSAGFTGSLGENISITVDGYLINITDRTVYTGQFSGIDPNGDADGDGTINQNDTDDPNAGSAADHEVFELLRQANATRAAFFVNAIDSRTMGLDIVMAHDAQLGVGKLRTTLAGTLSQTALVGSPKTSPQLVGKEDIYFGRTSQIYLESAVPRVKFNLTFDYIVGKFSAMLRNVYFGPVDEATDNVENFQTFSSKIVTDISFAYQFSNQVKAVIGANNVLDIYPDENIAANQSSGRFLYSRRAQQFGANGRYVFARLSFLFK